MRWINVSHARLPGAIYAFAPAKKLQSSKSKRACACAQLSGGSSWTLECEFFRLVHWFRIWHMSQLAACIAHTSMFPWLRWHVAM